MFSFAKSTLLVIAPHPDDEVIGCGGLISKIKEQGGKVYVLFMTVGVTKDLSRGGRTSSAKQRIREVEKVAKRLQFDGWRLAFNGNGYHLQLDQVPQKKLIHEIEQGKKISLKIIQPDILAIPMIQDYNQDHRAVAQAALTACRPSPRADKFTPPLILGFESPMNGWSPLPPYANPNFLIKLQQKNITDKLEGMNLYKSQVRDQGHPRHVDTLAALAQVRGALVGVPFAEAYYSHKIEI